jgi:hydroxymethylbilane synthase
MTPLRLGTRRSQLAQRQALEAADLLRARGIATREVFITTQGDRDQATPLLELGGQGVFVRQLEQALVDGEIDVAVHSAKDVPSEIVAGTMLAAYLPRADVRDALVSRDGRSLAELAPGSRIGSSSRRRSAQLRAHRPDVTPTEIRGNVDTRLRKLQAPANGEQRYDAIVVAAAGLARLGRIDEATELLPIDVMLPSPGQGAIVLQTRQDDMDTVAAVTSLNHHETAIAVRAERAVLARLGAGCTLPVAALAHTRLEDVSCLARLFDADGTQALTAQRSGSAANPEAVGESVAEALLANGGAALLQELVS